LRNVEVPVVLVEAARSTNSVGQDALEAQLKIEDLDAVVVPVGDVDFRLLLQGAHPDAVASVELAVLLAAAADRLDELEVLVEAVDELAAVAIDDIDVAVGRDGHVSRVREVELLRRFGFLLDVADLVENLAGHVGLVNAGPDARVLAAARNV